MRLRGFSAWGIQTGQFAGQFAAYWPILRESFGCVSPSREIHTTLRPIVRFRERGGAKTPSDMACSDPTFPSLLRHLGLASLADVEVMRSVEDVAVADVDLLSSPMSRTDGLSEAKMVRMLTCSEEGAGVGDI